MNPHPPKNTLGWFSKELFWESKVLQEYLRFSKKNFIQGFSRFISQSEGRASLFSRFPLDLREPSISGNTFSKRVIIPEFKKKREEKEKFLTVIFKKVISSHLSNFFSVWEFVLWKFRSKLLFSKIWLKHLQNKEEFFRVKPFWHCFFFLPMYWTWEIELKKNFRFLFFCWRNFSQEKYLVP